MARKQHAFSLDDDVFEALKAYAEQKRLSMSDVLTQYILTLPTMPKPKSKEEEFRSFF